jgi:hypothetical protein
MTSIKQGNDASVAAHRLLLPSQDIYKRHSLYYVAIYSISITNIALCIRLIRVYTSNLIIHRSVTAVRIRDDITINSVVSTSALAAGGLGSALGSRLGSARLRQHTERVLSDGRHTSHGHTPQMNGEIGVSSTSRFVFA